MSRIRVMNVITGLELGGAETALTRLVQGLDRDRVEASVVSLLPGGVLAGSIRAADIPLHCLGMTGFAHLPAAMMRLRALIRETRPHVVQTWLYHADLVGSLALAGLKRPPALAWNLRCSTMAMEHYPLTSRLARWGCALLSSRPALIIANSQAGLDAHAALGYRPRRTELIPNGFDLEGFRPDPEARAAIRREWGLADHATVIGLVARWDPQKDHATFVRAAALLAGQRQDVAFVLAGSGLEDGAPGIGDLLARFPVAAPVRLLGARTDMARILAGLDIGGLCSAFGEGFPNVVGEAMACGLPCVVTHVGDSASLVGETGRVVMPGDAPALAAAWSELVSLAPEGRARLGKAARDRIARSYGLAAMIARYESCWSSLRPMEQP
ncbi:MAG: glycosyltransferase [Phaeospirillum sp.]|nr:glycosyltransferase [Phaeospirillum sp.]